MQAPDFNTANMLMTKTQSSAKCLTSKSNHILDCSTQLSIQGPWTQQVQSDLPLWPTSPFSFPVMWTHHIYFTAQAKSRSNLSSSLPHPSPSSNECRIMSCGLLRPPSHVCPLYSHHLSPGPQYVRTHKSGVATLLLPHVSFQTIPMIISPFFSKSFYLAPLSTPDKSESLYSKTLYYLTPANFSNPASAFVLR